MGEKLFALVQYSKDCGHNVGFSLHRTSEGAEKELDRQLKEHWFYDRADFCIEEVEVNE